MLGAERILQTSLAPKSVTVPIAVSVAEPLGGIITITSVVVFCVGIFGSLVGPWLLRRCGVTDPMALMGIMTALLLPVIEKFLY